MRRRRSTEIPIDEKSRAKSQEQMPLHISEEEKAMMKKKAHACPVPKPPGVIGRILGFKSEDRKEDESSPRVVTQKASKVREDDP